MKKLFLGLAAVAALASCSQNETIDNPNFDGKRDLNRISFQPTAATAARGATANIETLQKLTDGFEVIGISNFGNEGGTAAAELFSGTNNKYKYTPGQWSWADDSNKDWPTGNPTKYPIRFFAAHPFPTGLTWESAEKLFEPADAIKDQVDQLAAMTIVQAKPTSNMSPLAFQHILSAIKFQLKSTSGYKVNIKEVNIYNVTKSRSFNYSTGLWAAEKRIQTQTYAYFKSTDASSTQKFTFTDKAISIMSGSFTSAPITDAGQLMLVPQTGLPTNLADFVTASETWVKSGASLADRGAWPTQAAKDALAAGAYIQVTYNMADNTNKYIVGKESEYVRVFFPLDLTDTPTGKPWEMRTRYTYTIYLGTPDSSDGILLDPDYKDENGGDTNKPLDNPKVNPGEPITKGKISFKVTVDDWIEEGNDIK